MSNRSESKRRGDPAPHGAPSWPDSSYTEVWSRNLDSPVICVSATPNASLVAAASTDRTVALFSDTGEPRWRRSLDNEAWAVAISADGARIAVGTAAKHPASGTVFVLDRAGQELWRHALDAPVWSVSLSDDGERLVVGSWDGCAYLFQEANGSFGEVARVKLGEAGVYGVSISGDGQRILAAAYDRSVTLFDGNMSVVDSHGCPTGTYHAALSRDAAWGVVGLRDGRAMMLRLGHPRAVTRAEVVSQRPICGAAVSSKGTAALGCFDGRAYITNREGRLLWSLYTDGEVWSTSLSSDASLVVVGSGDGTLRVVKNHANDAAVDELLALEGRVERAGGGGESLSCAATAVAAFRKYGLVDYAVRRLKDWAPLLGDKASADLALQVLREDTAAYPAHRRSHFLLASIYQEQQDWRRAALHYIWAGQDDQLRLQSLTRAGEAFSKAGLEAAAKSSFRRAREQQITEEARRTLYSLARAHEDNGQPAEARKYYEVLFTFNPGYRDIFARLERLDAAPPAPGPRGEPSKADWYDGLLLGLLGPDVPRMVDVDPSLQPILHARSRELAVTAKERRRILNVITEHALENVDPSRRAGLEYDVAAYMRYDRSVPEDEAKKSLELVHVLDNVGRYGPFKRSLDIGAATGRYPTILAGMGIEAFGLDVEPEAVEYARRKRGNARNPDYRVGDARSLPFDNAQFDLITCMMGTAAHFPAAELEIVLAEVRRCLRPGGVFILSTWDIECPHLSFLSIYSHAQMEEMRRNSPTRREIAGLVRNQGLAVEEVRPIGLMPEALTYELDLQRFGPNQIGQLVDVELAFRAVFPESHGQMVMVVSRKPLGDAERESRRQP
ncbi:methyltransferase domain-containing protein [Sorangium sp. So ce291]|uniref:methyltransferase domain-containing protein n=1 Tax=Sorangium sp. So ce291 TaxID=3133294 RepID=UPI003F63F8CE